MKTYIITNDERYAIVEAERMGVDTHSRDTIRVRSTQSLRGRRLEPGDRVIELYRGVAFDTLHRAQQTWREIQVMAAAAGCTLVRDRYRNSILNVVPIEKKDQVQ